MSKKSKLEKICDLIDEKIMLNEIIKHNLIKMNYISTENMLPDKNGIIPSKSIPSIGKGGKYKRNDTLLSNIRPYFKKIWLAKDEGACSNDVLIFRAKENYHHDFLYYNLANDAFFAYAMKTSKGTKMPRGDKTAIKKYDIYDFDYRTQQKLTKTLRLLDDEIELKRQINTNLLLLFLLLFILVQLFFRQINTNLERQAQAIFKEMFIQKKGKPILLSDFCDFIKGKNPAVITSTYQTGAAFYLNIDSLTDIKQTYAIPKNFAMANVKDILMVMDGASSGTVYFGKEGIIGSTLAKIVVSDLSMQEVIYQALKYFENDVRSHTTGSAIPHVDKQYILQLSVSLPDDYQLYSAYFETIRNMMIENRTKNICLTALRDTLLPKLMSGEIDVSKIELD